MITYYVIISPSEAVLVGTHRLVTPRRTFLAIWLTTTTVVTVG